MVRYSRSSVRLEYGFDTEDVTKVVPAVFGGRRSGERGEGKRINKDKRRG